MYHLAVPLCGLQKIMKDFTEDSGCSGRLTNQASPEYKLSVAARTNLGGRTLNENTKKKIRK
jgi:hypothetical protein